MKKLPHPGNLNRFPGEFLVLGLGICLGAQLVWGSAFAFVLAAILGLIQVVMVRRQRMEGLQNGSRADLAEAEARKWQERANTFMHELACFRETIDYEDPETGVGSTRQFEVEFIKQVARFRRGGQPFTVALLQFRDPGHADEPLDTPIIIAAAHRLAETARVEDALCRVARRGFAVLLAGSGAQGAAAYIQRARARFEETPVMIGGRRVDLTVTGGVAVYDPRMSDVQDILTAAARDLHSRAHTVATAERTPIPIRKAS